MFDNLVESGSHKEDIARKSSFFAGTLVVYAVLLLAALVASIYLYDAHLESQNLELLTLVAPVPVQQQQQEEQPKQQEQPKAAAERQVATRTELVASTLDPTKVAKEVSAKPVNVPPIPKGAVVLGKANYDPPSGGGPVGIGSGIGAAAPTGPVVKVDDEPPPPPKPSPTPPKAPISGGVLNGKAISKPTPPYPPIAKAARASGTVTVQIVVDETGKVISAKAVSGHPLLQQAAVQAAYQARFSPTLLSGQPVKVSGVITYNFVLQ
jgi:protein TonB